MPGMYNHTPSAFTRYKQYFPFNTSGKKKKKKNKVKTGSIKFSHLKIKNLCLENICFNIKKLYTHEN